MAARSVEVNRAPAADRPDNGYTQQEILRDDTTIPLTLGTDLRGAIPIKTLLP